METGKRIVQKGADQGMPKRTRQDEIDDKGQAILEKALADWAELNPLRKKDHGLDYVIEPKEKSGAMSGLQAFVQLKSSAKPAQRQNHISQKMTADHLMYYMTKAQLPVFLVVVDVEHEEGYWLFLQEYLLANAKLGKSPAPRTLTLPVRYQNRVSEADSFQNAVTAAAQFMVVHKVRLEQWRLNRQDPRFNFHITASGTGQHVRIDANEDVALIARIFFKKGDMSDGPRRLLMGEDVEIDQAEITGSPVFENMGSAQRITMGADFDTEVTIRTYTSSGKLLATLDGLNGKLRRGARGGTIQATLPRTPFAITVTVDLTEAGKEHYVVQWKFDVNTWHGKPVLHLPHFEQLKSFFASLAATDCAEFHFEPKGSQPFQLKARDRQVREVAKNYPVLQFLEKTRQVAGWLHENPAFNANLPGAHVDQVEMLYVLMQERLYEKKSPGIAGKARFDRQNLELLHKNNSVQLGPAEIHTCKLEFLGEKCDIDGLTVHVDGLKLDMSVDDLGALLADTNDDTIEAKIVTADNAKVAFRLPDDVPRLR
jgi:hypothetical protein